ncbi:MAG: Na/Pi cotransporter family protein, partial [Pseudomonadota bacterium]
MGLTDIMALAGGLAFFLYGMKLCGDSLQRTAGRRMRKTVRGLAGNRFVGLLIGFLTTLMTNSSSATTLMVVSFVGAGLMTLEQGIVVSLGACVGTSVAVQLIAFKVSKYALLLVAVGLFTTLIFRKETWVAVGGVLFGAGLVFFGIDLMAGGLEPLASSDVFARYLEEFNRAPLLAFAAATVVAIVTQSGAATIAMVMAFLMKEDTAVHVSVVSGIAWVIGANLGTASTGLLGSLRSSADGKRAALAHVLFKALGGAACLAVVIYSGRFTGEIGVRGLANAHVAFNLINAVIFTLLTRPLAGVCRFLIRRKPLGMMTAEEIAATRLDERLLATPEVALARSKMEIVKMSGVAKGMIGQCVEALAVPETRLVDLLKKADDRIDKQTARITRFLTALSRRNLTL